jgi:hypothetical protein
MKVQQFNGLQTRDPVQTRDSGRAAPRSATLSDEQASQVASILKDYNPKNLGTADVKNIRQAFRDAELPVGPGLKKAIEDAGFDAERLRPGGPERRPGEPENGGPQERQARGDGPGDPRNTRANLNELRALKAILDRFDLTTLDAQGQATLVRELSRAGLDRPGVLVDKFA